jgi:hypothetical protein
MFTAASSVIVKTGKQPTKMTFSRWMGKWTVVHPDMEYYSALKKEMSY